MKVERAISLSRVKSFIFILVIPLRNFFGRERQLPYIFSGPYRMMLVKANILSDTETGKF